ncbi:MAG: DegV family protein [Chloroflexi bacterium]|nr:DegV family protein [Chloroflexota bacterium]
MIRILTDSTADIPKELREAYHIETIPMYIQLNGKVYKDGEDIHPEMLFEAVRKTGQYPTTSAPPPGDFIQFLDQENAVIYISISCKLSTTYRNAQLAVKETGNNNVDVIDSLSISTGYGQVVVQAAKWRNEGMSFEELGIKIRERIKQTRGFLILDSLDYIYHGGRCSAVEHFFSSLLKINPFLVMKPDGTLGVLQKVRGSRKKAIDALVTYFLNQTASNSIPEVYITHLNCDSEAQYIKDKITASGKSILINEAEVGCVLATHSGPGPIGIAYYVQ